MSEVNCINPVLILSPNLFRDVLRCDKYFIDGVSHVITSEMRFKILDNESISKVLNLPYVSNISNDKYSAKIYEEMQQRLIGFVDSSFLLDSSSGETFNIWQFVPCGKCDLCQSHKFASLSQRALFAYEESLAPAYFVTLTYNNSHLPSKPEFVKRHVQLFFKRLRKNGFMNTPNSPLKYIYTCELGKHNRFHVHCIIFSLPIYDEEFESHNTYLVTKFLQYCWRDAEPLEDNFHYRSFKSYLDLYPLAWCQPNNYDAWSRGYVNVKLLNNPNSACKYVTKYAFKNYGSDKFLFRGQSCNLGLEFAKSLKSYAHDSLDGKFKYCSPITNKLVEVSLSSYFIKKLFPSFSDIVPVEFRRAWFDIVLNSRKLLSCDFVPKHVKFGAWYSLNYIQQHYPFMVCYDLYSSSISSLGCFINSPNIEQSHNDFILSCSRSIANSFDVLNSFHIDLDSINKQIFERENFLKKFETKSFSHMCKVASDFRRSIIINISKSQI